MTQRIIDLTLSALASLISVLLSWPYWRDFENWPESRGMWWSYFLVGYLLAVYVFYVFIGSTRTLFQHDKLERSRRPAQSNSQGDQS